jgi:predicted transcriptional regulator
MDADVILDILGNDTRRRILAVLAEQPMYFNQLAREVDVGQQAMLRHLQALEEVGLVETYAEKSDLGAPDRKYYRLNTSFILTVSLSADNFTVTNQRMEESRRRESIKYYRRLGGASPKSAEQDAGQELSVLRDSLSDIEQESPQSVAQLSDMLGKKESDIKAAIAAIKGKMDRDGAQLLFGDL